MDTKKWWFKNIARIVALALLLFGVAGTFQWSMAWLYVFLLLCFVVIKRHVTHPELHTVHSMLKDGANRWDYLSAMFVVIIGPLLVFFTAGLDKRFGWTTVLPQIKSVSLLMLFFGAFLSLWTVKSNRFYFEAVRVHYERQHVVITEGPYRFIRHPGYAGSILVSFAIPLMLGSWVALIPSVFVILGYIARTWLEDMTLQRQFKGYYDYTKKVIYRLVPGIW